MEQKFTSNTLVSYLYREAGAAHRLEIEAALAEDASLRRAYASLLRAYQMLPKVTFSPSRQTIQSILKYSQRTALEQRA